MHAFARVVCRILIALMIWTPYQLAHAGMIGTDQVGSQSTQSDRNALLQTLSRSDVQAQLQSMGVDPAQAKDRVLAMSDDEVGALSQRINALPAGGMSNGAALVLIIVIVAAVWWYVGRNR
jgi:hypothetical protein